MKKVLIPTKLNAVARETLEANGHYEVVQDESTPLGELIKHHADTYALIVRSDKVTAEVIDALPGLKVIVRAGAGVNTIDTRHARRKGVDVMNTPGANSNAVAEEVLAMMLADARHVIAADASARAGKWEKKAFIGREIAGKTVGIVGLGNTGRLVARRLSGFDVKLLGHDPFISDEKARDVGVTLADLPTIFSRSDYITLHIPEIDETRGMLNDELLAHARQGATIINCARAGIVDEDALRRAKQRKGLRYLNDVYARDAEGEKSIVDVADIMLPHLGANTVEANFNAARRAAEELIDRDERGVTSFIVNRGIPEGLDEGYCDLAYLVARLARCLVGRDHALTHIKTSFYGSLEEFGEWLLVPAVAGLWEEFDRSMDHQAAVQHLDEMGIEYLNRRTDPAKGYGNSITIDLTARVDADTLRSMSIRGTIAEGIPMIARINNFNKLYFEPTGCSVFFLYDDRPGVIGTIGMRLAEQNINIEDMRNPHDAGTNRSLAIMKINSRASDEVVAGISREIEAVSAFSVKL